MNKNTKWAIWVAAVAFACSLTSRTTLEAEDIKWRTDIKAAAKESIRTKKPMLLKVTADWCFYCKKMKKSFEQKQVAQQVNSCFVPILVDMDENQKLADALGVKGLPTTVIISTDYEVMDKITGYQSAEKLEKSLSKICEAHKIVPQQPVPTAIVNSQLKAAPQISSPQTVQQTVETKSDIKKTNLSTPSLNSPFLPAESELVESTPETSKQKTKTTVEKNPFKDIKTENILDGPFDFKGLCLVSLLDERLIVDGSPEITSTYHKKTVCFSSEKAKKKFDAHPERYWPLLDGQCMMSHLELGIKQPGNPEMGAVYRGQLWFFSSEKLRQQFAETPGKYSSRLK